ncbi:MAG: hypothetical protein ABJ056_03855 [Halioglobus sp.]
MAPAGVAMVGVGRGCPSQAVKAEAMAAFNKQLLFSLGGRKGKGWMEPVSVCASLV